MKFLVVYDHYLIREAMGTVRRDLRGEALVLEAADAAQALAVLESQPDVDLVLLDLHLPDRDGFEVLAEICDRHPSVSVVMLSASNDQVTIRHALDRGAMGFIPKTETRKVAPVTM